MKAFTLLLFLLVGGGLALSPAVYAQSWNNATRLYSSQPASPESFGESVAVTPALVVAGAPVKTGATSGYAMVYGTTPGGTRLVPNSAGAGMNFGIDVAAAGKVVVVGTAQPAYKAGKAFVYTAEGNGWQEQVLQASNATSNDGFGRSVATDGTRIAVGAVNTHYVGAVYVFARENGQWVETRLPTASATAQDWFGEAVAIDGNRVVVGARSRTPYDPGSVIVYEENGGRWSATRLTPVNKAGKTAFGRAVAIDGNTVVVGAPADDRNGTDAGCVYVYTFDGSSWQTQVLRPQGGQAKDHFGASVAIAGETMVVGAPGTSTHGSYAGGVYVYRRSGGTWQLHSRYFPSDAGPNFSCGTSVALAGDRIVMGCPGDNREGFATGSVLLLD